MTAPGPLRLVRWTHEQTRALTVIARQGADRLLVPAGGTQPGVCADPWNIRMRPLCSKTAPWSLSHPVRGENTGDDTYRLIGFEWDGARLWGRVSSRVCDDWLALRMPDLELGTLPPLFVDAAWDAMVRDVLTALGIARLCPGIHVLVDELPDHQAAYPYAWTLSIRSPDTSRTLQAELAVDDAGLQRLSDLLSRMPPPDDGGVPGALDALSIVLVAQAGETTLQAAELRGLEAGDVVLFDQCRANLDGDAWLVTPDGQGMRVRACEPGVSRYVVTQEWSSLLMNDYPPPGSDCAPDENRYPPMGSAYRPEPHDYPSPAGIDESAEGSVSVSDPMARAATRHDGPNVDRIPVHLVFDLGEHKMTLGELRRLKPGEFFDLQRPIDAGPVHIRANGTLIGTAELVDIDGRIGARVLTLVPGRDSWD